MKTANTLCRLLALMLIAMLGCAKDTPAINQLGAASVLLQQFETVFYSRVALLSSSGSYMKLSKESTNTLRVPFAYLLGVLNSLGTEASSDVFANSTAVLVGVKDFRAPAGLGAMHSKSCYIMVLKKDSALNLPKAFHQIPVASVSGMPIWTWSAELGEFGERDPRPSSLYALQAGQSYAAICNDISELQRLAEMLNAKSSEAPTISADLGMLSQHEVWGYRQYRHAYLVTDNAAGTTDVTSSANALIFFLDSKEKTGNLRLLASDPSTAEKINTSMRKSKSPLPSLKLSGPETWEAIIPLSDGQQSIEAMVAVMSLFGFGVYL